MVESGSTNHAPEVDADITLTDILLSSSPPETLPLTTPPAQAYLTHLTSLPLPTLLSEPTLLQTQSHHLTSSLTSLTHTSYPTFLSLHHTTTSLSTSLASFSASLDSLVNTSLPALEESAEGWRERTDGVLQERKKARVVLEQHDKIRDLLDIPLLIDTCVRNGYFAEALSLASHATSLSTSLTPPAGVNSPSPPLILTSILAEVHQSITQMLLSLLVTLHEPNRKLPALWKAVNFLRKMDVFGGSSEGGDDHGVHAEEQIALAFLGGREGCLKAALEGCGRDVQGLVVSLRDGGEELGEREKDDVTRYLKKYIDMWREGVYDIVTQYTTIFLERAPSAASAAPPSKHPPSPSQPHFPITHTQSNPHPTLHPLLTTYTTHALTIHLLPLLYDTLPHLPPSSLPSLLTQLTYCATAFARVGMDFRGVLGDVFCKAVGGAVGRELREAGEKWRETVRGASRGSSAIKGKSERRPKTQGKDKSPHPPSKWLIIPNLISSPPTPSSSSAATTPTPTHIPPSILASYPPLAEFTNAILGTYNGLRLLAPIGVLGELVRVLEETLVEGGKELLGYIQEVCGLGKSGIVGSSNDNEDDGGEGDQEERVGRAAGEVYMKVFVPYMRKALIEGVYGMKIADVGKGEGGEGEVKRMIMEWEGWLGEESGEVGRLG